MDATKSTSASKMTSNQTLRALDYLSFFIGDVMGGIGPYLAIYLRSFRHWEQGSIGVILSAMGMTTIVVQIPAGALMDSCKKKRALFCFSTVLMGLGAFAITIFPQFSAVLAAQIVYGVAAAFAGPCIVAISLGVVGSRLFAARVARNEAFNHLGNVMAAIFAGAAGYALSQNWIFYMIAFFAVCSTCATFFIKREDIDDDVACGADESINTDALNDYRVIETKAVRSDFRSLFADKHLVAFAIAVTLFHMANAAMLPLAGQYLAERDVRWAPIWISACIITAQVVMVPASILAGHFAETWGRKPVFLLAMMVLPLRGFLYTLSNSPYLVVPVQLLDGIGAGIFGVLVSVIVADLTAGTGRYNSARGVVMTAQGIGAALSNLTAGAIVQAAGYRAGFLSLTLVALIGLVICYVWLPETHKRFNSTT
ncbi:MAG TPA: MFS transporter [Oculatellaceae cyanobacterium]